MCFLAVSWQSGEQPHWFSGESFSRSVDSDSSWPTSTNSYKIPRDFSKRLQFAQMSSQLLPGTKIGRYEIRSPLGAGGMGEVYLAEDTKLGRNVALKFLSYNLTRDEERVRRFSQEARAASALNHPTILTIYEIGEADGRRFIATEFVEGQTLRQRILARALETIDAVIIAEQIASALTAAHAAGIVHRDIKPENIMLRSDGLVKVVDFGLAKLTEQSEAGPDDATRKLIKTSDGVIMGTVAYMSPEQARGLLVDARSDIFSLGVVIYEMVSGRRPFAGETNSDLLVAILKTEPPPLSRFSSEVPTELVRIVNKALRKDREERYQGVKDLLLDLKSLREELDFKVKLDRSIEPRSVDPEVVSVKGIGIDQTTRPTSESRGTTDAISKSSYSQIKHPQKVALLALAAFVVIGLGAFFYFNRRPPLTDKDTILLADFVNTTGETVFDGTLKQGLMVQLQQTPFLHLFPPEAVRETLTFMGRSPDERITRDVGREICQRRGLKALVMGTISNIGSHYVITLEAIGVQTGEPIATEQVEAESREQVLKALGQAATGLRKELGESLNTLKKYDAPIEQATTSSLEALQIYSKGQEQIYSGHFPEALPLFKRAIELDPNFAAAYNWLTWTYVNIGDYKQAAESAEKAFSLIDRVTELEKLHILDIYYLFATDDWEKQREVDELLKQRYPNDWIPHNSLAITYLAVGQPEKAVAEEHEAIRLVPNEIHTYWHLARAFIRLNRFDEARTVIQQTQAKSLDAIHFRRHLFELAFVQADASAMRQQLDLMTEKDGESEALLWQARAAAFAGRWREAEAFYRRAQLTAQPKPPVTSSLPTEPTIREALLGFCRPNAPEVAQALAISRIGSPRDLPLVPIDPHGSLCGDLTEAQKLIDEMTKRYPQSYRVKGMWVPVIRAAMELRRDQPERAIEFLQASTPYEGGPRNSGQTICVARLTCDWAKPTRRQPNFRRFSITAVGARLQLFFHSHTSDWRAP